MPVSTHGLAHLALLVADPDRSAAFYARVFGAREYFRGEDEVQTKGPGATILAFRRSRSGDVGRSAGIEHFGFRLTDPRDLDAAVAEVEAAGGTVVERGRFTPSEPYAFVRDPDGYLVEIWYEPA
jgi:catechol 2,3-dioxygenase-like lactoylglutathione lyase family enzyme